MFAGLSGDELAQLSAWLDIDEVQEGKHLTHQGASDYAFFVVKEGHVRVERDGRELAILGPGDVFGEMAFFGDGRRNADVITQSDARVLFMFGTRFREMQAAMPDVCVRLEDLVRQRTESVSEG